MWENSFPSFIYLNNKYVFANGVHATGFREYNLLLSTPYEHLKELVIIVCCTRMKFFWGN